MASGGSPQHVCGVVLIRDPIEGEKAYIGLKMASEEKADLLWIKAHGNKFSTKIAKEIIYRVGKWL